MNQGLAEALGPLAELAGQPIGIPPSMAGILVDSLIKAKYRRTQTDTATPESKTLTPKRDAALNQLAELNRKTRWRSKHGLAFCFHEAGHGITASRLGVRVGRLTVDGWGENGLTEVFTSDKTCGDKRAAIAVGGAIAELRHRREPLEGFLAAMSDSDKRMMAGLDAETIEAGFARAVEIQQRHYPDVARVAYALMHHGEYQI